MRDNGYSMSSTAFTHEDREDDKLVSVDDLNMAAEAEAMETHEEGQLTSLDDLFEDSMGRSSDEFIEEREMERRAESGDAGVWNGRWFTNETARANGFPDWEAQMDFERRMEKE